MQSDYTELLYNVDERVATITFNRPDRMNAWTATLEDEQPVLQELNTLIMKRWPAIR